MSKYVDRGHIINEIKRVYNIDSDTEFANFLDVKPQTISSWRRRNTLDVDLIYSKCVNIDGNFLISGEGDPIRRSNTPEKKYEIDTPASYVEESPAIVERSIKKLPRGPVGTLPETEIEHFISDELINIPLIDIEAAAGSGSFNPDYIEVLGQVSVPANMLSKRNALYYAIRSRGSSMSPTIFDRDLLIIRYLEKGEWQELRDEYVYIVVSKEGYAYVKRIKDRLRSLGIMVLTSDNLDKTTYPNFSLENNEISNLFFVEMKISPYLQNINASYYDRVKFLEDEVEAIKKQLKK